MFEGAILLWILCFFVATKLKVNQMIRQVIAICLCLVVFGPTLVLGQVVLRSDDYKVEIDPATLGVVLTDHDGQSIEISSPQDGLGVSRVITSDTKSMLFALPERGWMVTAELAGKQLTVHFKSTKPGEVTWPIVNTDKAVKGYILPMFEGVYAPADDDEWMQHLIEHEPLDTTADLSMPFVGFDLGDRTLTYIIGNMFDNQVDFTAGRGGMADVSVTHRFMPNWKTMEYSVIVELGDASPIEPAKAYRRYLEERGEFVSFKEKIEANPHAERLLGAAQAYLWDHGVFSHMDVTDWKAFAAKLIEEGEGGADSSGSAIWQSLDDEARKSVKQLAEEKWPGMYPKSVVATQISAFLEKRMKHLADGDPRVVVLGGFCKHYEGLVLPYEKWGDGISIKMLDVLQDAGLDRMVLCLGDLSTAESKPQVAARADELGYLFGPYDAYHSIHPPVGHPDYDADNTWETAQFPPELFETGPIVKADGTKRAGFKKVGYLLSPLAARPYVEKRVNDYMSRVPYTAVFVDCDAFGQYFDDYSPDHTATKQDDLNERLDRLNWLSNVHGLVVGSEGGNACAASAIHFAHGMLSPVIGWGDADMRDKNSPYFTGAYWPPQGPGIFIKQVPLKPKFKKFFYDPRYRLPLYQAAFHDSLVTTHHWGNASLKFEDQIAAVALLEQLYNVPPLYHLNHAQWKKHREHILKHYAFFSPLHRELGLKPMTGFQWLNEGRTVQQTTFEDGTRILANFQDESFSIDGYDLPSMSVLALYPDGRALRYAP